MLDIQIQLLKMQKDSLNFPSSITKTTDILNYGSQSVRKGADLPEVLAYHCTVKMNATHVLMAGGVNGTNYDAGTTQKKAYLVDVTKEPFQFLRAPDMIFPRESSGCGR